MNESLFNDTFPTYVVHIQVQLPLNSDCAIRRFCRAMLASIKRGLSRHAVSVCPSVTFVHFVKMNKDIF